MDTKKGCKNCPFKFCVADNCKMYKKLILSNNDEIMYIVKDKYKYNENSQSTKKSIRAIIPLIIIVTNIITSLILISIYLLILK